MHPTILASASPLTSGVVSGPPREAVVLSAMPPALYLGFPEHAVVLPVVTSEALLLPTSLRLADHTRVAWGVERGDLVTVGENMIQLPGVTIRSVRQWRPRRVAAAPACPTLWDWREFLAEVGRGPGLTPRADDVLSGALLAARAVGIAVPETLPLARTTSLSASLLVAAWDGYAVAAVVEHVMTAVSGSPDVERTRAAVRAIGHTSGEGLLEGIDALLSLKCCLSEGMSS